MAEISGTETTDPLPQPSLNERLTRMEAALSQLLLGQKMILQEVSDRYVDLRERIEINNDKLGSLQREFNLIARDLRGPTYSVSGSRLAGGANTVTD